MSDPTAGPARRHVVTGRDVADTRTAAIAVTDTPPLARYSASAMQVTSLVVKGERASDNGPWSVLRIQAHGFLLIDDRHPQRLPMERTYNRDSASVNTLSDAPAWLHELALEALDGPAPADPEGADHG